jgi:outer membrane receptor protein involved in Fe transport
VTGQQVAEAGGVQTLDTIEVTDSATDLVGAADTATVGTVLKEQLDSRPVYREGELLENVPGLIVTQHSGEGKANQYYLRGFNLDHGTDLAITIDDMPVNMPTHAHGQGYSDLNFMIPELVSGMKYEKGPYFADQGDFATAGAVQIGYLDRLDKDWAEIGGGSFGYARGFTAMSRPAGDGNLLVAVEAQHLDGPWVRPDDYHKGNGVIRYSEGTDDNGWSTTAMAYAGKWNATNQIPERAVNDGQLSYYGTEDPTDGGRAQRYSLSSKWVQASADSRLKANVYVIASQLDLFNNFTFYLYNPVQGDQFHQHDVRLIEGGKVSYTMFGKLAGLDTENTIGTELRNDGIHLGLYQTYHQQYLSTDRVDQVQERSIGTYYENRTAWLEKLRTVAGVREDYFTASDHSDNFLNGGNVTAFKTSPKGSVVVGPWAKTEFYLSGGMGIHSNDVRSATSTVEPTDYNNNVQGISGTAMQKFPLLERAIGYEIGTRTAIVPHLQSSLALFRLNLASEQVFDGDAGDTAPSGASTRQGVEFANFYTPIPGVVLDADAAVTQARFHNNVSDGITSGKYIAGSPRLVLASGVTLDDFGPWFGGVQYRMYGPRPLTDDNSVRSPATTLVNIRVGYRLAEGLNVRLDVDNLLNAKAQDISYYYASRLQSEPLSLVGTGVNDVHFHAAEPRGVRLSLVARW